MGFIEEEKFQVNFFPFSSVFFIVVRVTFFFLVFVDIGLVFYFFLFYWIDSFIMDRFVVVVVVVVVIVIVHWL